MWGQHVEAELQRAQRGAKDDKQARSKLEMRFRTLMHDPEEEEVTEVADESVKNFPKHLERQPAPTKFRDPMDVLRKKGAI